MKINKENIGIWDMKTTKLNDIAFQLSINNTKKRNIELAYKNELKRCTYTTQKDFVKNIPINKIYQKHIKEAKIIIRRYKIEKIKKCLMK